MNISSAVTYTLYFVFLVAGYLFYKYFYRARKTFHWYGDMLENLGYKVYRVKWKPLGGQIVKRSKTDYQKYGDCQHFWKNEAVGYDVVLSNIVNQPLLIINNPDLTKAYYDPDKIYLYKKNEKVVGSFSEFTGKGVVFDEGTSWKKKRKTLNNVFNFQFIKNLIPFIKQEIDSNFQRIEASEKFPRCYIYQQMFARTLGQVTAKSFFGEEIVRQEVKGMNISNYMADLVKDISLVSRTPDVFLLGPLALKLGYRKKYREIINGLKQYNAKVRNFLIKKMKKMEEAGQQGMSQRNVLAQIMKVNKKTGQQSEKYSLEEIISEFNNLYLAGLETTSQLLTMMVYYLALHPEAKKKAMDQINSNIKTEEDINFENLKKMRYLEGVQYETLRLYGPGTGIFVREAVADHKLLDVPIWKGTLLLLMFTPNCYNEKYFKDAHAFKPERWLEESVHQKHPFVAINFSSGPRSCLGKQLALIESKIFLIKFLRRYGEEYTLENENFKYIVTFGYVPQKFDTILKKQKSSK